MIARIRKSMEKKDQGFTLIELLVVMIIIGILASIAIPVFLNQRKKARDTAAKADVSTLGKEIAAFYVDGTGNAPTIAITGGKYIFTAAAVASDIGPASSNIASVATTGTSDTTWCVQVTYNEGTATTVAYKAASGLGALGSVC